MSETDAVSGTHAATGADAVSGTGTGTESGTGTASGTDAARARLARAQTELLAALVAGAEPPPGFDRERLAVQRRALRAKRADVVAKVAPELPRLLGPDRFREAFRVYAAGRPLTASHRHDALAFAAHTLAHAELSRRTRRALRSWHALRAAPAPPTRLQRLLAAVRRIG